MSGLLIIGAGGFARETAQAVRDAGDIELLGHLDDNSALHGTEVDGVPVLGGCDLVHDLPEARVVICVGNPRDYAARARLVRRLGLSADRYATVVHPTASVSATSEVGPGSVLLAHCVLTAAVRVGAHVAVMPHVVLTHDDVVEDFATIASGVRLGGERGWSGAPMWAPEPWSGRARWSAPGHWSGWAAPCSVMCRRARSGWGARPDGCARRRRPRWTNSRHEQQHEQQWGDR